jgi:uncharacterized membrane protein YsdA (DUF1294 family)
MLLLLLYLALVNLFAFIEMGYDKAQAKKGGRRTPEKRLMGLAAAGGALGGWIGMRVWRHKTKHASFVYGFPLLFLLNVACVFLLVKVLVRKS